VGGVISRRNSHGPLDHFDGFDITAALKVDDAQHVERVEVPIIGRQRLSV